MSQEALVTAKSALDQADATLKQTQANVLSARANLKYQQSIQNFEKVYAPFDGVITYRKYDVGQYLSPTQSSPGQEIYDVQETDKLRAFVNVPQGYANNVAVGQAASLIIRNFPGKEFHGKVTLTAGAVDPNTRTLKVQIDIDNSDGKLLAGEFCELKLPVSAQKPVFLIPSSGLNFIDQGQTVGVLDSNNKIHIKKVTVGRDFGATLEILEGLDAGDRVLLNPGERFAEGVEVEPREQAKPAAKPAASAAAISPTTTQPMESTTRPTTAPAT